MGDSGYIKGTRVYVGGLREGVKKEDLESEFEKYGKLNSVWVAFNPPGFAFIEFLNKDEAESACDGLNGTEFLGSKLRVEISRDRGHRGSRGAGYRGGSRGSRAPFSGRGRGGGGSFSDRGYRGSRGGGRGRGRYDDYGGRGGGYSRSYDRDGGRDGGYGSGRDGYGSRDGYGGNSYDSGPRYRSRSPISRGSWQ